MSKEDTKPISHELAKVISLQQQYIKQHLGDSFDYLFSGRHAYKITSCHSFQPKAKVMSDQCFMRFLKKLAFEFDIKDNLGKLWNFQSHQFRHTVGCRLANLGIPLHIIQRYLGHESPRMTMVYAHIHDETLRKEIDRYHSEKVVNFSGEFVDLESNVLDGNDDLEWFKKNVQARALEHGYCARPIVLGICDIPGFDGCYNCPHWRTNKNFLPVLKSTLERTKNVLDQARTYGWNLQVDKNIPIKENLEKVIKALEKNNDQQKD
ncbi:MAG: tyrosine-type recombinase/integrase [Calothrix sp. SM1_7_51]|nr:tyrosine-type recombinase/integrase [Calothrix sp. SM1_7_51]